MITLFTCEADGCDNQGITYRFEAEVANATCGGCGTTLEGKAEADV